MPTFRTLCSGKLNAFLLVASASFILAGSASAQIFKVTATGTISAVYDTGFFFNSSVVVGTPFTFSFLFDYSTLPSIYDHLDHGADGNSADYGVYRSLGSSTGATVVYGDYKFIPGQGSVNQVKIDHNYSIEGSNEINLGSSRETATGFSIHPFTSGANIQIDDMSGLISSALLPSLSTYDDADLHGAKSNYNGARFFSSVGSGNGIQTSQVQGIVTSLSAELVNPVPEASTTVSFGLLLALGGVGLVVRRRRAAG